MAETVSSSALLPDKPNVIKFSYNSKPAEQSWVCFRWLDLYIICL